MADRTKFEESAIDLSKKLADDGKLVEAGAAAFLEYVVPKDAPEIQRAEMLLAFMAGAEHLFSSIMVIMDSDREPTIQDLAKMEKISAELDAWRARLFEQISPSKGRA